MKRVDFIIIGEGSSDEELIPHLSSLLVDCGVDEATGNAPDFDRLPHRVPKDIKSKVSAVLEFKEHVGLLFIHRDADAPDPEPRYREIATGMERVGYKYSWIGVVPVQKIEAWLLLDESSIRRVSGRPSGNVRLNMPHPNQIERISDPKARLFGAIRSASETTGRRRDRLNENIFTLRTQLIGELKVGGDLDRLSSWVRLKEDVIRYVQTLQESNNL